MVEVLPTEPVIPTTGQPSARRHAVARRCSAASGSSAAMTAPRLAQRAASACSGATSTPHAPPASACAAKRPPSTCSPTQPDEQVAGPGGARVDHRARRAAGVRRAGATSRPPAACATCSGDHVAHAAPPGRRRRRRRAPCAPPSNSWPCSWPLPATTTTSPGRGQRDGALDRRAAVDASRSTAAPARPAAISAMIASGSSLRGLSEVTIATSARSAAARAHQRALAAVAVAAGAEDDDHAGPSRQLAGRAQHVLQRVGRVRVVDEDGEGLALVDGLEAPGHAPGRAAAPRAIVASSTPSARADDHRAERVEDVEAARQRRAQRQPVDREASSRSRRAATRSRAPARRARRGRCGSRCGKLARPGARRRGRRR